MNGLRQGFWGQGGFLSPQHLQCQAAWQQRYSLRLHAQATPFYWGFEAPDLREEALGNGVVEIERFTLIPRDGARISGGSADPSARENATVPARHLADQTGRA